MPCQKGGSKSICFTFIRFESMPGQQIQIDWGHFGSLVYGDSSRKLYALAVIESHSRKLYVNFIHSQNQSALHLSLVKAFQYFGGTPREIVVDKLWCKTNNFPKKYYII